MQAATKLCDIVCDKPLYFFSEGLRKLVAFNVDARFVGEFSRETAALRFLVDPRRNGWLAGFKRDEEHNYLKPIYYKSLDSRDWEQMKGVSHLRFLGGTFEGTVAMRRLGEDGEID